MGGSGRRMKLKRILALLGVLLLAGLVILFFVLALTGASKNTLMAVVFSILFFSILFYAMGLMVRVLKPDNSSLTDEDVSDNSTKK